MADAQTLLLATAIIFGAAFVQGVTGFGHALLAIGLLTLLFGSNDAILILSVMAPAIAIAVYVRHWRKVDWREVMVIALGDVDPIEALAVAEELRDRGISAAAEYVSRSPGAGLKRATKAGCRYAVLLGEDEVASGRLTVKDLETCEQFSIDRDELAARLEEGS